MNQNIPFNLRLPNPEQIKKAREKWDESEWILSFLRSEDGQKPHYATDEKIIKWMQQIN